MSWWLIHNTLTAALLAAVVVVICRWRRAHPALRHALWLVVLAKLIAPPLPVWNFAWPATMSDWWRGAAIAQQKEAAQQAGAADAEQFATQDVKPAALPPVVEGAFAGDPETYEVLGAATLPEVETPLAPIESRAAVPPSAASSVAPAALTWAKSLTWSEVDRYAWFAWLASVAAMGCFQLYHWRRFQGLLDSTRIAPDWLEDEVHGIAEELRIAPPMVLVMDVKCTPLVWVLGRARLLWPEAMLTGFSRESRRTIIAHELAHLARRDHWVARIEAVATPFWWWHPLFWYVRAKLHDAAEQACDARVTQLLPGARKTYAQALIEVCELLAQAVTPGPALGIGSQTRRAFERRLTMIMREKVSSRLSLGAILGIGVLTLAVLPGFTPAQVAPPAPEAPAAPAAGAPALPPAPVAAADPFEAEPSPAAPAPAVELPPPALPGAPTPPIAVNPGDLPPVALPPSAAPSTPPGLQWGVMMPGGPGGDINGAEEVVHLTRATYRLPQPLAEFFAAFLNNTMGDSVQAKVQVIRASPAPDAEDGSRIIVTTDEDSQRIVGQMIGLLRARGKFTGPLPASPRPAVYNSPYRPNATNDTSPATQPVAAPSTDPAESPSTELRPHVDATRYAPTGPVDYVGPEGTRRDTLKYDETAAAPRVK